MLLWFFNFVLILLNYLFLNKFCLLKRLYENNKNFNLNVSKLNINIGLM